MSFETPANEAITATLISVFPASFLTAVSIRVRFSRLTFSFPSSGHQKFFLTACFLPQFLQLLHLSSEVLLPVQNHVRMNVVFLCNIADSFSILNHCHNNFKFFFCCKSSSCSSHKVSFLCIIHLISFAVLVQVAVRHYTITNKSAEPIYPKSNEIYGS